MSTDLERLVVSLEARMAGYERAMNRSIGKTNTTARGIENRFERMNGQINRGFQAMGRMGVQALGAIGVAVGGAQLARLTAGALQAAALTGRSGWRRSAGVPTRWSAWAATR